MSSSDSDRPRRNSVLKFGQQIGAGVAQWLIIVILGAVVSAAVFIVRAEDRLDDLTDAVERNTAMREHVKERVTRIEGEISATARERNVTDAAMGRRLDDIDGKIDEVRENQQRFFESLPRHWRDRGGRDDD